MKNFELICQDKNFKKHELENVVDLAETEVLVAPSRVGICGSDLYSIEVAESERELRLGHEWIGHVISSNSSKFKPGDLVTSPVVFYCGKCEECLNGRANNCHNGKTLGNEFGALRSQLVIDERYLISLEGVGKDTAVLLEIASVAEQAFNKLKEIAPKINDEVLIFGAGPIGVMCALKFEKEGIPYKLLEINNYRYKLCKDLGLNVVITTFALMDAGSARKYSYIIDCSGDGNGASGFWQYMMYLCKTGAKVLIVGKYINTLDFNSVHFNNLDLTISWMRGVPQKVFENTITEWKDYLPKYADKLISHVFSVDDASEAFDIALRRDKTMKVIVEL